MDTHIGADHIAPEVRPGNSFSTSHAFLSDYKKEIAVVAGGVFAFLAFLGVINYFNPVDLKKAEAWAAQTWVETPCTVESIGIAYRGDCNTAVDLRMARWKKFGECSTEDEAVTTDTSGNARSLKQQEPSVKGICAARTDRDFVDIRDQSEKGLGPLAPPRHLDGFDRRHCNNGYLPWARVRTANASGGPRWDRCAYEFGTAAPSVTGSWRGAQGMISELKSNVGRENGFWCWVLKSNPCIVAFHDQNLLAKQEREKAKLLNAFSVVCAVISAAALSLAGLWHCRGPDHGGHAALPTLSPRCGDGERGARDFALEAHDVAALRVDNLLHDLRRQGRSEGEPRAQRAKMLPWIQQLGSA